MKQRNTDIDWIRAILIILMILIHIVSFGNAYPQLKAGILSFMMPFGVGRRRCLQQLSIIGEDGRFGIKQRE